MELYVCTTPSSWSSGDHTHKLFHARQALLPLELHPSPSPFYKENMFILPPFFCPLYCYQIFPFFCKYGNSHASRIFSMTRTDTMLSFDISFLWTLLHLYRITLLVIAVVWCEMSSMVHQVSSFLFSSWHCWTFRRKSLAGGSESLGLALKFYRLTLLPVCCRLPDCTSSVTDWTCLNCKPK